MKKLLPALAILVFASAFMFSCSSEKKASENTASVATNQGFDDLKQLSTQLISSLKNNDYNAYSTYVFTRNQEKTLAGQITNEEMRNKFIKEFGFSLKEEKVYFNNLVNYMKANNFVTDSLKLSEMEIVDFEHNDFHPVTMKTVIIPLYNNGQEVMDLDFVAVMIDNKWFLTSELEL
jgi:hypothetical protein